MTVLRRSALPENCGRKHFYDQLRGRVDVAVLFHNLATDEHSDVRYTRRQRLLPDYQTKYSGDHVGLLWIYPRSEQLR